MGYVVIQRKRFDQVGCWGSSAPTLTGSGKEEQIVELPDGATAGSFLSHIPASFSLVSYRITRQRITASYWADKPEPVGISPLTLRFILVSLLHRKKRRINGVEHPKNCSHGDIYELRGKQYTISPEEPLSG